MSKELMKAIQKKDLKNIKVLIEQGADINYKDNDGIFKNWTPLHHSIFKSGFNPDFFELSKFLIDKGANLEAKDFGGNTPIISVIKFYALDLLDYLIQKGADINVKDKKGADVFDIIIDRYYYDQQLDEDHIDDEKLEENKIAIKKGEGEALSRMFSRIDAILENGFDINSGEYSGAVRIILEIAENKMPSNVLSYLISKNANIFEYIGKIPILQGAINSNVSITVLTEMIDKIGINYVFKKFHNATPLLFAVKYNNLTLVKKLIEMGADSSTQNNRALKSAEEKQHKEIALFLKSL